MNDALPAWKGMLLEMILTFNFIMISLGVIDADRRTVCFPGFPIGMAVACGIFAAVSTDRIKNFTYTLYIKIQMRKNLV